MDIIPVLLGGFVASVAWFFIGSVFYVNPYVAKLHAKMQKMKMMRKAKSDGAFMAQMYFVILANSVLAAVVYSFIKPMLAGGWIANGFSFGLIILALAHIPSILDKLATLNVPRKLTAVDLVSGIVGCFVIGLVIAFFV